MEPTYQGQNLPILEGHSVNILYFWCFSCNKVVYFTHQWLNGHVLAAQLFYKPLNLVDNAMYKAREVRAG
jgi:hypothetical protein